MSQGPLMDLYESTRTTDVIDLCRQYYKAHSTGGSLHIVLDDGNYESSFVAYCAVWAMEADDLPGVVLALRLLEMNDDQRRELTDRYTAYARGREQA